jgi:restriction system protein
MALWLVRAGGHGEYEQKFLDENRVYLTWDGLNHDLGALKDRPELRDLLVEVYPDFSKGKIAHHVGQIWTFGHRISRGDWVVLPSKYKPAIHMAEVVGDYQYDSSAEDPFYHFREVDWLETDIPRTNFDQDLLYSFGAFMTICEISRNDAERRVRSMANAGWASLPIQSPGSKAGTEDVGDSSETQEVDLEELGRDRITRHIGSKFKGHAMARLVGAILKAQGYTVHISPPGPDKGVDLLASQGPLGFSSPRICVQVKSGSDPVDRPTMDQLIGTMQNFQAEQGLLVSWGGFKTSVDKEKPGQFFRVRLWDRDDLIDQLIRHYEQLDSDLKAELPLKKIWTIPLSEEK